MKEEPSTAEIMNRAGIAGLALGAVSTAYMFIVQYLPHLIQSPVAVSIISALLWIAKFGGCIYLMAWFMTSLARGDSGVEHRHTLRLGLWASVFSALIFSAASLANTLFINPEEISQAFDQALGMYAQSLDSNSLAAIENVKDSMPVITFFSNFFYCVIYGSILSSILSRNIPKSDPFAAFRKNDGESSDVEEQ